MAERSSLNQIVQIGVETTPGTAVAANRRLQSVGIEPSINADISPFRPIGSKFNALTALSKEWVEASITGRPTYTELVYVLSSVLTTGVTTAPEAGVTEWVFSPSTTADDDPVTFTVEHGSGVRADRFAYGLITEMGLAFSRNGIELSGSMLGRALEDPFTMTADGVTSPPLVPVLPTQVSVYLDNTAAGLGTTKMTRMISANFNIGSRFGPVWVLDAAQPSFVNHIETEPDLNVAMVLQADAQGMALLGTMRAGDTKFLRIEAEGGNIGATTVPYRLTLDVAVKISDTGGFSDQDGVYAIEFTGLGVNDATWGRALRATVVNDVAAL